MKIPLLLLIFIVFASCERDSNESVNNLTDSFFKSKQSSFQGYSISQFGRKGCLVNISSKDGYSGNLVDLEVRGSNSPQKKVAADLIEFCKDQNLYYYQNVAGSIVSKSNNTVWSYEELKEKDPLFFYTELEVLNESEKSKDYFSVPLSICFLKSSDKELKDSVGGLTKLYRRGENFYFWQLTPQYLDCEDCLIR